MAGGVDRARLEASADRRPAALPAGSRAREPRPAVEAALEARVAVVGRGRVSHGRVSFVSAGGPAIRVSGARVDRELLDRGGLVDVAVDVGRAHRERVLAVGQPDSRCGERARHASAASSDPAGEERVLGRRRTTNSGSRVSTRPTRRHAASDRRGDVLARRRPARALEGDEALARRHEQQPFARGQRRPDGLAATAVRAPQPRARVGVERVQPARAREDEHLAPDDQRRRGSHAVADEAPARRPARGGRRPSTTPLVEREPQPVRERGHDLRAQPVDRRRVGRVGAEDHRPPDGRRARRPPPPGRRSRRRCTAMWPAIRVRVARSNPSQPPQSCPSHSVRPSDAGGPGFSPL